MNTYAKVAAGITRMLVIDANATYVKLAMRDKIFGQIWYIRTHGCINYAATIHINNISEILNKCSNVEILNYLKLLIPIANSEQHNKQLDKLALVINCIEKDIYMS